MTLGTLILAGAWLNVCGAWAYILYAQFRARRLGVMLCAAPPPAMSCGNESVCVIVPARNEAANIEGCVRSILSQDHPCLSVIVVNDRSADATAQIVRGISSSDARRLRLIDIDHLPAGWLGKSHALWRGASEAPASADWLLFVDADCRLTCGAAIRIAIAEAHRRSAQLLTLWPRNAAVTFWEHALIPLCGAIVALWFGSADPRSCRSAPFANGQFLLVRKDAYAQIDGHRAVRNAIIEDVPLAEKAHASGLRLWTAGGRDLASVRMYRNLREIHRGWSRIYVGALRSGWKILLSILWLCFGSLLPFVALPVLLATSRDPLLMGVAMLHLALMMIVSYRFWNLGGCRRTYLWIYPLSVLMVIGILARAWWSLAVRRQIGWRDTCYPIDARAQIARQP